MNQSLEKKSRYRRFSSKGWTLSSQDYMSGRSERRLGMTLTELLVVIMITVILLGTALPIMRTALEDRAQREASRQLNTYVQLAKSRAAQLGRPVGIFFDTEEIPERFDPGTPVVFARSVFLAETPPPYAGDVVGARVKVYPNTNAQVPYPYVAKSVDGFSASFASLVQVGDRIKFDFKGSTYPIRQIDVTPPQGGQPMIINIYFNRDANQPPPVITGLNSGWIQYQVFRQPQKSSTNATQLTGGAVIDLTNSGLGLTGREFAAAVGPFVIMFQPDGSVDRIAGGTISFSPTSTIHLLIGSLENMMQQGSKSSTFGVIYNQNLEETTNLWVSIGHQTGNVVTADNAWVPAADLATSLTKAREFAQAAQAKGGR